MFCTKCGAPNDDNAWKCVKCGNLLQGQAAQPAAQTPQVPTYLVQAIICTLLCCVPFGIVAIVFASQVNTKLAAGDLEGAKAASQKAKMWCWVSFGVGIVFMLIWAALNIFAAMSGNFAK